GAGELAQLPLAHRFHHLARGALEACLRALATLGRERRARGHLLFLRSGRHEILPRNRRLENVRKRHPVLKENVHRGRRFRPPVPAYRAGASIAGAQLRPPCARQSSSRRCSNMALASQIPPPTTTMRKNSKSALAMRGSRAVSTFLSCRGCPGSSMPRSWGANARRGMGVRVPDAVQRDGLQRRTLRPAHKARGCPPAMVSFTTLTS